MTFTHGHSQVGLSTPQHSITHETTPTGVGTPSTNVTLKPVDNPEKTENVENITVKEEPLAEPLGPSSDDENCVYFKISKSDMNKPDFAKFFSEAIQQNASGDKADSAKSDTKIVTEDEKSKVETQQQTHEQVPVINEIVIDNTMKSDMGPVAFVLPVPAPLPPPPPPPHHPM